MGYAAATAVAYAKELLSVIPGNLVVSTRTVVETSDIVQFTSSQDLNCMIASASLDETVRLWDLATGAARRTLEGHLHVVWAVAFSPDGKLVASASGDKTVRPWDSAI